MTSTKRKRRRRRRLRRTFLTGMAIILPLFITFWVIWFIFTTIDAAIAPSILWVLQRSGQAWVAEAGWLKFITPVVSVTLLVLLIYLLGVVGGSVIGGLVFGNVDKILSNVPVVRGIYSATRQFMDTFWRDKRAFRKVVLVEYPRQGLWTLALLTNDASGEVPEKVGQDLVSVFVPTTPNPTSGWLLFVPIDDVIELKMTVDDAFKLIISGGVLVPEYDPHAPDLTETTGDFTGEFTPLPRKG